MKSDKDNAAAKERHTLVRPASVAALIYAALSEECRSEKWLRRRLGWSKHEWRAVMEEREPLTPQDAWAIDREFGRPLKLLAAQIVCQQWDRRDAELAKERNRNGA